MGLFSRDSKTLISKAPERSIAETIKTILSIDDTNPSLCNTHLVQRLLQCLGLSHLYIPIEHASFLGAFGESMVFIIKDIFGLRYILKMCLADYRDKISYLDNSGQIRDKRITDQDKDIFKKRFLGGVKNQIDIEKLISNRSSSYGVPRVQLCCNCPLFVVMEYIEGINIFKYAETLKTDKEVLELFYPLLDFVDTLDKLGLMHRDIKPANIIISSPRGTNRNIATPYLLDWGQSKLQKMRGITSPICGFGTAPYASPQCGPLGNYAKATVRDDIYSLGMLMWELITKKTTSAAITSNDYGDINFMTNFHEVRARALPEHLRLPYLVATKFQPSKRFISASDFKTLLKRQMGRHLQEKAEVRINNMEDITQGGKGQVVDCTSFIDVTLSAEDQKKVITEHDYKPRKVLKTMVTMPIELIEDKKPMSNAVNMLLTALEKSRRRSK